MCLKAEEGSRWKYCRVSWMILKHWSLLLPLLMPITSHVAIAVLCVDNHLHYEFLQGRGQSQSSLCFQFSTMHNTKLVSSKYLLNKEKLRWLECPSPLSCT